MKNEPQIFAIGVEKQAYSNSKTAMGFIQIGKFEERFELVLDYWNADTYLKKWNEALRRLVDHRQPTALLTRMLCPQTCDYLRVWTLYPEGKHVFIHEKIFIYPAKKIKFDSNEHIINLEPRETTTEEGDLISEWKTSLSAIEAALKP
jgi:hypothetical protein